MTSFRPILGCLGSSDTRYARFAVSPPSFLTDRHNLPLIRPRRFCLPALVLLLFGIAEGTAASEQANEIAWSSLSYGALLSSAEIEHTTVASDYVQASLLQIDGHQAVLPDSDVVQEIRAKLKWPGTKENSSLWVNEDGNALQRVRTHPGKDEYSSYRYLSDGVWREYKRADEQEMKHVFYAHPQELDDQFVRTEPLGLFYILGISDLTSPGDQIRLFAFSRRGSTVLTVVAEEVTNIKAKYVERSPDGTRRVKGKVNVLRVSAKPESGEMEFLGLKGELNFYLDPVTRVPLRITGRRWGKRKVSLNEVFLR